MGLSSDSNPRSSGSFRRLPDGTPPLLDPARAVAVATIGLRILGAGVFAVALLHVLPEGAAVLLPFFVLACVARLLRVPVGGLMLDLEAAAVFPAVVLTRSWEAGIVLGAASAVAIRLLESRGRPDWEDVDGAVDLVFAYGAASYFFVSLAGGAPSAMAMVFLVAAAFLVFFFARVLLGALHTLGSGAADAAALVRGAAYQFLALVLLSPVVALVVMLYPRHGFGGSVLAFTSVALVSASLRNLSREYDRSADLARQNRELTSLREVSVAFAGAASDASAFERLFRSLSEALPVRAFAAIPFDGPDGKPGPVLAGEVTVAESVVADWGSRRRELASPDAGERSEPHVVNAPRDFALNADLPLQVLVPLRTPETLAGLLVLESDDPALGEPPSLRHLSVFADHVALSLQDRNLRREMQAVNERLQSRAETLHRILEISNDLKSHLSLDHVLTSIVRAVHGSLGFRVVLLSLHNRQEGLFERRAHVGLDDDAWEQLAKEKLGLEEITRYFSDRFQVSKSYFVPHDERGATGGTTVGGRRKRRSALKRAWHAEDLLFIPLTAGNHLVGVLQVDQPKNGLVPRLEEVQALEIFANQAVTAIQSARAYETTRQMTVRDALTNAFNHRHFQETLYREVGRHMRSGQTLAVMMVDLDDFKKINDGWGHPVGDLVLKGLVEELQRGVREMDTVARYGGEEFGVVLPETTREKATAVAERLRARIAARKFETSESPLPLSVTISVGLAVFPQDAGEKAALIEKADQALYLAKRSGKNCVVSAEALGALSGDESVPGPRPETAAP